MEIRGNTVLITGGCGGIGMAIGREFLKLGKKIILCDLIIEKGLENLLFNLIYCTNSKNIIITCFQSIRWLAQNV